MKDAKVLALKLMIRAAGLLQWGMMSRKLYLETFGCQMNVLDSELLFSQLRRQGYVATDNPLEADVVLYNTCSVRQHAEQKVWSRLGRLRPHKLLRPQVVIGVIGCMAERDGRDLFRRHPHVDILCGPGELDKLPGMISAAAANADGSGGKNNRQVALMGPRTRRPAALQGATDNLELLDLSRSIGPMDQRAQAYVRITRGCNKFCTYCVVPFTRGPEIHRPPQNIIDEVKRLADAGVKEVTLLGQTVNHYHYQMPDGRGVTFADLLYRVHEATPHLPRLRFVTSFPRDFTQQALEAMRDCPRICRYLHIPAQSGSDRILKAMNRGYSVGEYKELIDQARAMMPDISLAGDFIVGFPTESEADFAASVQLLEYCRYKNSFIFKYSPRPGTSAMRTLADDVPEQVKRQRNQELLAAQQRVCLANNAQMHGQRVRVLVEHKSKLTDAPRQAAGQVRLLWEQRKSQGLSQWIGRTGGDQIVAFDGAQSLEGQLLSVKIDSSSAMTLFGSLDE